MDSLKKTLPELALESAMIVLSVLLALAANSWADAHKEHKLAVQTRESFVEEVRANSARVMLALPYHRALTDAVLLIDSTGGVSSYAAWKRRVPIWSGFAPPDIASTAWQSALATGALSRMPLSRSRQPVDRIHASGTLGHVQCGLPAIIRFLGPDDVEHRAADARVYANDLEL